MLFVLRIRSASGGTIFGGSRFRATPAAAEDEREYGRCILNRMIIQKS